jgi:hypothetical protein
VPLVKEYAPEQVAGYVPENTSTLVRINGAAQLLGGVALATVRAARSGAVAGRVARSEHDRQASVLDRARS